MNSKEFKEKLTSVTPDVPEHFHLRTERTLENIVSQEAHMKESTKKAIRTAGRYSTRTMILAAALAIISGERTRRPGEYKGERCRGC